MTIILEMYISLMPPILAGILNMAWCKAPFGKGLNVPIDHRKILKDGKRLFGDNKTWKGFLGISVLTVICAVIWGAVCGSDGYLFEHNYMYRNFDNTLIYNIVMGLALGFAYALFELPNSFIKRRMGISPGKAINGLKGKGFVFFDQADSVFGCVLVLSFVCRMTVAFYFLYVLVGTLTHLLINVLLYLVKLRKNMF